jgi:hypothetical protein
MWNPKERGKTDIVMPAGPHCRSRAVHAAGHGIYVIFNIKTWQKMSKNSQSDVKNATEIRTFVLFLKQTV